MNTKPFPSFISIPTAVLSFAVGLQAVGMIAFAFLAASKPIWILFGFECVVIVAAVFGWKYGRGQPQAGRGLAGASIGGTVLLCSGLAWLAVAKLSFTNPSAPMVVKMYLLTRLAIAVWFGGVGAWWVLSRSRASIPYLKSVAMGAAIVSVVGAGLMVFRGPLAGVLATMPDIVRTGLMAVGLIFAGIMLCHIGHNTIRAFECGRNPDPDRQIG